MTVRILVGREEPTLLSPALEVETIDESTYELLDDMVETMVHAGGVGLAAPQIGVPLRVFVMQIEGRVYELINPVLIRTRGEVIHNEACLSVPGFKGETKRAEMVTIRGLNRKGMKIRIKAFGLRAQCVQHEMDHLDGLLYTERLTRADSLVAVVEGEKGGPDKAEKPPDKKGREL